MATKCQDWNYHEHSVCAKPGLEPKPQVEPGAAAMPAILAISRCCFRYRLTSGVMTAPPLRPDQLDLAIPTQN